MTKEERKAYNKSYHKANPEKLKANDKAYYKANSEKIKAKKKSYQKANSEKIKAKKKSYRKANPEKEKAYSKAYYKANPEKIKARSKKAMETISQSYIATRLHIPISLLTPELIDQKRLQLKIIRLINQKQNENKSIITS